MDISTKCSATKKAIGLKLRKRGGGLGCPLKNKMAKLSGHHCNELDLYVLL